ncbi:putative quinol monooxygenase [Marivita sp.]|uniref:putative quinol monooxygenase n=1 Tax=Marivita sp. TaxID=2003365 RepID=UPI0025C372A1|nr:putative quinol monooxygenase [Marivita sp.]
MPLTIVADIRANPGHEDDFAELLTSFVEPTRAEQGCVQYDLHRDDLDPGHFLFFEIWKTRGLLQDHIASPHIAGSAKARGRLVASAVVSEMTRIA